MLFFYILVQITYIIYAFKYFNVLKIWTIGIWTLGHVSMMIDYMSNCSHDLHCSCRGFLLMICSVLTLFLESSICIVQNLELLARDRWPPYFENHRSLFSLFFPLLFVPFLLEFIDPIYYVMYRFQYFMWFWCFYATAELDYV